MVENAPIGVVIARLGVFEIEWMPAVDATSVAWADIGEHQTLAAAIENVLETQRRRLQSGIEATEIAAALSETLKSDVAPDRRRPPTF